MSQRQPEDEQKPTTFTFQENTASGPHFMINSATNSAGPGTNQTLFYTQEQDEDLDLHLPPIDDQNSQEERADQSSPFVLPFQNSAAMPAIAQKDIQGTTGQPPIPPAPGKMQRGLLPMLKIPLIASIVLITIIGASFLVFAQSTTSPTLSPGKEGQTHEMTKTSLIATPRSIPTKKPTSLPDPTGEIPATPHLTQGSQGQETQKPEASTLPTAQLLQQLGWTQAGLSLGDAFEALRTGITFADREMSYDYRNIGTPAAHSGTLTGSVFLLTPGGQQRFAQNDKRAISTTFYNQIHDEMIIQQVVNGQPTLTQFQVLQIQGQTHRFAWVDASFELFQSKIDPATGQRTEQLGSATGQPLFHHLAIVLVQVALQDQGPNAPMGGTGWLVNTYALDAKGLPAIATSPSL